MGEYLSFNKSGQWELRKATNHNDGSDKQPESDYKPGSEEYKVYRGGALNGDLLADHGQKGSLKDFNGGKRTKDGIKWNNAAKPHKENQSAFTARNPGVGD